MRYREGDKVEIIDQSSEFYKKKGYILTTKISDKIFVAFRPEKSSGHGFTSNQIKLVKSAIRGQEIEPDGCCISSLGGISASVLEEDCPIKRSIGLYQGHCTCINNHYMWGVPTCEHYKELKEVVRGGRKVWRVSCDAVEINK
jgi:hypothetical protein